MSITTVLPRTSTPLKSSHSSSGATTPYPTKTTSAPATVTRESGRCDQATISSSCRRGSVAPPARTRACTVDVVATRGTRCR
jgi:hypothetical protein